MSVNNPQSKNSSLSSYWLTRIVFLRSLSFIYTVAFIVAKLQNRALIGVNGLTPADLFLARVKTTATNRDSLSLFINCPTILWFLPTENLSIDFYLDAICWFGLLLSSYVLVSGEANAIMMLALWLAYHSLVNVGQTWYSFGWESQLLETGFIGVFMCPLVSLRLVARDNRPSFVPILLGRWLIFRIMIGAGMIKIRGDKCWRDLTCMNYHYETQPVPNPLSYYLHQEPRIVHQFETLMNHVIELIAPWMIGLPQPFCKIGGAIQIVFQVVLIISGNLSFLNWLTIVPSICCLEDRDLQCLFSRKIIEKISENNKSIESSETPVRMNLVKFLKRNRVTDIIVLVLIGFLSFPVIRNILSANQIMNTSFDSFRIVNTYGAFGSITKQRTEIIIEGSWTNNPYSKSAVWKTYEFKCKPGNLSRRPCIISPYHYRLDWLMWFAAFQNPDQNVWFYHLIYKLLNNDETINELIEKNPFFGSKPPNWIRAMHYRYKFRKIDDNITDSNQWWVRDLIGEYVRPLDRNSLKSAAKSFHWDR